MKPANVTVFGLVAVLFALFASLSFLCSGAADAESFRLAQTNGGGRVALVVGNANYPGDDRPPLSRSRTSARSPRNCGAQTSK